MAGQTQTEIATIKISSPVFEDGGLIPQECTCSGENISPPLNWEGVPEGAQSLALIVDDPDASDEPFVHWVLYDLPPDVQGLSKDMPQDKTFPIGGVQGINSTNRIGYMGPCPASGTHRYYFTLYALDEKLNMEAGETKDRILDAMEGHIIGRGQIMGRFKRT